MNRFLENHKQPTFTQEEIDNLNSLVMIEDIELVIKTKIF